MLSTNKHNFYILNDEQKEVVVKLTEKYNNSWLKITLRKDNKICKNTVYAPGTRYKISIVGEHLSNEIGFEKDLKNNNIVKSII